MVGWTNILIFFTHFLIFVCFAWFFQVPFGWSNFYLVFLMFQMSLLALGIGMFLSAYCLRFRDLNPLWAIVTQILFWLTPITYPYYSDAPLSAAFISFLQQPLDLSLKGVFDFFVRFQPLSILIHDARRALLYPLTAGVPSVAHIFLFTLICLVVFGCGAVVFQRRSKFFIQEY